MKWTLFEDCNPGENKTILVIGHKLDDINARKKSYYGLGVMVNGKLHVASLVISLKDKTKFKAICWAHLPISGRCITKAMDKYCDALNETNVIMSDMIFHSSMTNEE